MVIQLYVFQNQWLKFANRTIFVEFFWHFVAKVSVFQISAEVGHHANIVLSNLHPDGGRRCPGGASQWSWLLLFLSLLLLLLTLGKLAHRQHPDVTHRHGLHAHGADHPVLCQLHKLGLDGWELAQGAHSEVVRDDVVSGGHTVGQVVLALVAI